MPAIEAGFWNQGVPDSDALALYGPTLMVRVGFDPEFNRGTGGAPNLPDRRWPALVDTGASRSCISSNLAIELGLPVVQRGSVSGVHGTMGLNLHAAQIHLPELDFTLNGRFYGIHLTAGGQPQYVLIGRDLLRHFKMVYDGRTGAVTIGDE